MKKFSVATLFLSCVRLAGCAKTVTKDEAVKAAGEFKTADVADKFVGSSKVTTNLKKWEVSALGVKTSKNPSKETDEDTDLDPTKYRVSATALKAASDDGTFKINGKAISYSYTLKDEELASATGADKLYTSFEGEIKYEFSYNSDGLLIKEHAYRNYEGTKGEDNYIKVETDVVSSYTWKKK